MTDTPPASPIIVNASPLKDQIEAGLRQAVTVLGPIVTILAATGWGQKIGLSNDFSVFVESIGAISTIAALVIGQMKTRSTSQKAASMANQLPNTIAQTK